MLKKILLATSIATLLFTGCSNKEYYEPKSASSLSGTSMGDELIHYSREMVQP